MRTFAEYRKKPILETAPAPAEAATMPDHLAVDMERMIDQFVTQLKQQLANPMTGPDAQRGVWDRMKNWWSNMWHGRYNQQNPYFWKNKLGDDLGRTTESVDRIPLEHYKFLHEQASLLENGLAPGAEKLQVIRVVDQWAGQFKNAVMALMARHNRPVANPYAPSPSDHEHEVPTVGHEPEEDREDSHDEPEEAEEKPKTNFDDLETRRHELMDKLKLLKGKMGADAYERAKNAILTGDENALNQAEKFMASRTAILDDDGTAAPAAPKPKPTPPEDESAKAPAPDKRQWKELSVHEREQWDAAGGGHAHSASLHARNNFDIKGLPWILRIGDPRLTHLESIVGRQLYSRLVRQKRIELPGNPIKSPEQLAKAVEEAKRLYNDEYAATSTDRTERHKKRTAGSAVVPTPTPTKRTSVLNPPDPAPEPTAPAPKRTATLDPTDPTADPTTPKKKKGKLKPPRTAAMSDPPPSPEEEENHNPDELEGELESIKGEIDDSVYQRLKSWIEKGRAGEVEYIKGAKKKINSLKDMIAQKDAPPSDGSGLAQIESNIRDKTAFLVANFRHRVNESNKEVSIQGSKKKKNVFHSRLSME